MKNNPFKSTSKKSMGREIQQLTLRYNAVLILALAMLKNAEGVIELPFHILKDVVPNLGYRLEKDEEKQVMRVILTEGGSDVGDGVPSTQRPGPEGHDSPVPAN